MFVNTNSLNHRNSKFGQDLSREEAEIQRYWSNPAAIKYKANGPSPDTEFFSTELAIHFSNNGWPVGFVIFVVRPWLLADGPRP
jgi:hypothetical protein